MRNIYKYELKKGNKLVYVGITNNPERRKSEHLLEGKDFDKMNLVGRVSTLKVHLNGKQIGYIPI